MKKLAIALVLAVVTTLCFGTVALAAGPTDTEWDFEGGGHFWGSVTGGDDAPAYVHMTWDGGGDLWADVTAGDDAETFFGTGGNDIEGFFYCVDGNSPYLGVDYFETYVQASVDGGGYIEHRTTRTDSSTTDFGCGITPSGQYSRSWVNTSDSGFLRNLGYTQYWALYGFGTTLSASGDHFYVESLISSEIEPLTGPPVGDDGAYVSCEGWAGSTTIVLPRNFVTGGDGSSYVQGFQFGCEGIQAGAPWYLSGVESSAVGTGEGLFQVQAWSDSYLGSDAFGYELPGGGSAHFGLSYDDGFTQGSFATRGSAYSTP